MKGGFLQNMAPNAKRSFFVSLVFAAVATALFLFAVDPVGTALAKEQQKLLELQDRQTRMSMDLKGADTVKKRLADAEASMRPFGDAMLEPLLGSYAMRAKSLLDPLILGAGLTDPEYTEEPFRALPVPKPVMPRQLHTRAAVRVSAKGSYQAAVSFLLRLERDMPLVSLQTMSITAQNSPSRQSVEFVLEWPAKGGLTRK